MLEKVSCREDFDALPKTGWEMLEVARDQALRLAFDGDFQKGGVIRIRQGNDKRRSGNQNARMRNVIE